MIHGIVPVGGEGTRLGLPFPKELLPLKGKDKFYPVCQHTVDNLLEAGCEKITFVHGKNYKNHLVELYKHDKFRHILNPSSRQSEIFIQFYESIKRSKNDIYLYGLPDSWYTDNLFLKLKETNGIVCGMFLSDSLSVVDRLNGDKKFVKSKLESGLSEECWGVLKFDYNGMKSFYKIVKNSDLEVAGCLNLVDFSLEYGGTYFDLGTWDSLNKYWSCR